jgi:apolipoprotein N-acyltransferase
MWMLAVLSVAVSASAFYVSTGLGTFWPAAWIAPVPILVLAAGTTKRAATLAAFAAYFLGSLNLFAYLTEVVPFVLVVVLLLVPAVAFAGAVLVSRFAVRRLAPWVAGFAFPTAWVSYEFFLSLISPHGTALSLAYSQADVLPLVQIASLSGIWGITFLLTLTPSALAVAWTRRTYRGLAPAVAISLVVFAYGVSRLQERPQQPGVRVGLAAADRGVGTAFNTESESRALAVARAYANRIARLAHEGAQVVVLPEKLVGVTPADSEKVLNLFSDAARAGHVTLVAGLNRIAIPVPRNVAIVFAPDGKVLAEYEKHYLLPGPETGYKVGTDPVVFAAPGGSWGVAICKDMDFPTWSRGYGKRGVTMLAVPAWDFVRDAHLRSRMAVVRGVENGFAIARTAQQGVLTLSDPYGRILAEEASSTVPQAMLVRDISPGPGATLYTRYGDWFGWVNVLILAALLARAAVHQASSRGS